MKKIDRMTKKFFDELSVSEVKKDEIYENIVNKKVRINLYRLVTVLSCCFILIVGIFSVAYAEDIKNAFNTLKVKYLEKIVDDKNYIAPDVKSDSQAVINYKADLIDGESYSYEELSDKLGISILRNSLFKKNNFTITFNEKKDNNIGFLVLEMNNALDAQPDVVTKYSSDYNHDVILVKYEVLIATKYTERKAGRTYAYFSKSEEFYLNNLNTKAILIRMNGDYSDNMWEVRFDYNNISYHLSFIFATSGNHREELINILNSFEI